MKLRTFRVLCYLCVLCTFVLSEKIDWKNQSVSNFLNSSSSSSSQEPKELPNANSMRDKRALGLILSGLAQVFGYTVSPVQIASLPNPNSDPNEARGTQSSTNGTQTASTSASSSNSTGSSGSSTTVAPRQRESIRFTGVVNFGNSTGLLTQLQRYETIFHGGNNSSSSTTSQPPSTSPMMPQFDLRTPTSDQPLLPPLLVNIPLPVISETPLPAIPQPPLPEIPPQDIKLSYPQPFIPIRQELQMVYRNNQNIDKLTVENKNIFDGRDVQSPPPPATLIPYTEDPRWKKEYEDRLAELERKQEEHAMRLRQQEWYRNRQNDNYSGENDGKEYNGPVKQVNHGSQDSGCRGEKDEDKGNESSEAEDRSRERNESEERVREYSTSEKTTEPEESDEEEEERDEKYKDYEDAPQISENYTSIQYTEPLPLSEDDEQQRPEELRDSYGELLNNSELFDGFVNYFSKFKEPLSDFYSLSVSPDSKETSQDSEEDSRGNRKDEDRSSEKTREEEDVSAKNKYEEYSLEEDTGTKRKDGKGSNEESSESPMKQSNVSVNGANKSYYEEQKITEEVDFNKYMPFVVPVRYLSAPQELKKAKSRISTSEKSGNDNNVSRTETAKKVSTKDSRRPKKENLKAAASFPERSVPKKLHEGEQKDVQMWPPPFDFILDSTIHANVVPVTSNYNDNIKLSNTRRKSESSGKRKDERQQQRRRRVTLNGSTQRPDNPEEIYSQDFKNDFPYGTASGKQLMLNRPINSETINGTRFEVKKTNSDQNHKKEEPDFWGRYKYTLNDNYRSTEQPNIEIQYPRKQQVPYSLHSKKFEALKRSIEKTEPTINYYTELYPAENKEQINVNNRGMQNAQIVPQIFEPTRTYDPRENYNLFGFGGNTRDVDYGSGNERMSGVFKDDRKIWNEEAIGLTMPQQDVYRYDESLTKFVGEPERKSEKAGGRDYGNGATTVRVMKQDQIRPNGPISYVDYSRVL